MKLEKRTTLNLVRQLSSNKGQSFIFLEPLFMFRIFQVDKIMQAGRS